MASTWVVSVVSVIRFVSVVSRHIHNGFGNAHVVQAILVGDVDVVEPRTLASLPGAGAEHAEVYTTTASHMVAALSELDHGLAVVAALPSLLFSQVDKPFSLWILGALAAGVQFVVAQCTHLCLTSGTATVLAALKPVHVGRLDPLAAALCRTV